MRRSCKILIKSIIIFFLSLAVWSSLTYYLQLKQVHEWYSFELTISRGISISLLNILFYGILLVINIHIYRIIFFSLAFFGIVAWNVSHLDSILDLNLLSNTIDDFLEIVLFISTSIVAPGLLILIIYYIKKFSSKFEGNFIGKYHLHEGLFGIILVGLGILFFAFRTYVIQFDIFLKEFKVYLAIIMIFLYFFLFFGGFFILRDFNDIIRFRFVKKIPTSQKKSKKNGSIFNSMTHDNISFFRLSKLYIFPLGALLTGFSFSMVIYGTKFIPKEVLSSEVIINLGYLFGFFAGSLIGFDWLRVFKRFYPKQYKEIELKIIELQNTDI